MINKHKYKNFTWVDLESPEHDEVRKIADEFSILPYTANDLLMPTLKPHVDVHSDYMYLVLHFPARKRTHLSDEQEVDFIIGKDFLITAHYETIDTFHKFAKIFDVNAELEHDHIGSSGIDIFLILARHLYKSIENEIDQVHDDLEDIEEQIFEGHEKEMVVALSNVGRDILNFKEALDSHQDVLKSLLVTAPEFSGDEYKYKVRALEDVYYRVLKHVTRLWQTLTELRETNNSLLSTKQNEVMKIFTILAFVTFPLSLIAGIFGMNTKYIPLVGLPHDFWIVVGVMLFATILMAIYFKKKDWM